jgi:hypothetical protein
MPQACPRGRRMVAQPLHAPVRHGRRGAAPRRLAIRALLPVITLVATPAQAHVKWFAPYNVAADPTPLPEVFSGHFLVLLACTIVLIMLVHVADRVIEGGFRVDPFAQALATLVPHSADIMRIALGAFMLCLWLKGGIILTPELTTTNEAISWFQLGLAATTITWRTSWVAGLGILVLYGVAIGQYGIFHLLDYPLFLGIAAYIIIHSLKIERLQPYALSILYFAMAQTLLWASVEKWAFGAWTMPLLLQHERITLGIDHRLYLTMAGYVEFVAAFLLLYGRTSQRLSALMLFAIFVAAVIDFGKVDAVGHAMIIAALLVVVINGNTIVNAALQNRIPSLAIGSLEMGITYLSYILLFFTFYYGAHGVIYGSLR